MMVDTQAIKNPYQKILIAACLWLFLVGVSFLFIKISPFEFSKIYNYYINNMVDVTASSVAAFYLFLILPAVKKQEALSLFSISKKGMTFSILAGVLFSFFLIAAVHFLRIDMASLKFSKNVILLNALWNHNAFYSKIALFTLTVKILIIIPIIMEFIFRYFLIEVFKMRFNLSLSVVIASLIYGFVLKGDWNVSGIISHAIFGCVLSLIYLKSRSLIPSLMLSIAVFFSTYASILLQ